ncbi:hypothetical protein [Actinokineospora iranica]|uniref:Integral membrane protein n=1 Tax=Actinokineospora iranica TaxID=1271860 RepID=A0A1G6KBI5_9PSEU|nr:hypothetical protein [Actinokineospora iranica]SDC28432.1 hypothetical protein SAMN05216174_101823 [Actinokineospora iranica]
MSGRPLEVRVAAVLLAGAAVAFAGLGVARSFSDSGALRFPLGLGVLGLLAAVVVVLGRASAAALVFAAVAAVAHVLIALGGLSAWLRAASGVLAAVHGYVVVLLLTRPAREYFGGAQ